MTTKTTKCIPNYDHMLQAGMASVHTVVVVLGLYVYVADIFPRSLDHFPHPATTCTAVVIATSTSNYCSFSFCASLAKKKTHQRSITPSTPRFLGIKNRSAKHANGIAAYLWPLNKARVRTFVRMAAAAKRDRLPQSDTAPTASDVCSCNVLPFEKRTSSSSANAAKTAVPI
jgi:hypothetical protein